MSVFGLFVSQSSSVSLESDAREFVSDQSSKAKWAKIGVLVASGGGGVNGEKNVKVERK